MSLGPSRDCAVRVATCDPTWKLPFLHRVLLDEERRVRSVLARGQTTLIELTPTGRTEAATEYSSDRVDYVVVKPRVHPAKTG